MAKRKTDARNTWYRYRKSGPCPDCGQPCTGTRCRACYNEARRPTAPPPRKHKPTDGRSTQAWRRLRDQVVREEPTCWLQLPCCTGRSQTADHVLTVKERPDLVLERTNLRGACHACNRKRRDTPVGGLHAQPPKAWLL